MELALYHPEIPQNTGTLMRLGACLNVKINIIEPCGFVWNDRKLVRAGMDYLDLAMTEKHFDWHSFRDNQKKKYRRIVLVDVRGKDSFHAFEFYDNDTLVMGRESDGVPDALFDDVDATIAIPMSSGRRSINMALAATIVLSEALRQVGAYDKLRSKE